MEITIIRHYFPFPQIKTHQSEWVCLECGRELEETTKFLPDGGRELFCLFCKRYYIEEVVDVDGHPGEN